MFSNRYLLIGGGHIAGWSFGLAEDIVAFRDVIKAVHTVNRIIGHHIGIFSCISVGVVKTEGNAVCLAAGFISVIKRIDTDVHSGAVADIPYLVGQGFWRQLRPPADMVS